MLFSKLSIASALGLCASVLAFDYQRVIHDDRSINAFDDQLVTTDDFRVLTNANAEGYQLRIKQPQSCEQGVQYSGYIDNLEQDDHFFFWFFESRSSPKDDPTVLWLNGGPGCSSMMGAWMELGPCRVNDEGNDTTVNAHSWNSVANVIFLDQPVNVGYSYGKTKTHSTAGAARDVYAFLQIFLTEFNQYAKNPFHITGESYAGHYLPGLAAEIISKNKFAEQHGRLRIHLDSVAIGNGFTEAQTQFKYYQNFGCAKDDSKYQPIFDDESCAEMEKTYPRCHALTNACYRYPSSLTCVPAALYCEKYQGGDQFAQTGLNPYDIRRKCEGDSGLCYDLIAAIDNYANLDHVRQSLGVDPSLGKYSGCSDSVGYRFVLTGDGARNFEPQVAKTLGEGVRVLLYVGDKDYICNWMGNKAWSLDMDWPGQEGYNAAKDEPWINKKTNEQAGEIRTYKNLSFLRVYDAGHMVPYDQPANSLDFFGRWLKNEPLNQYALSSNISMDSGIITPYSDSPTLGNLTATKSFQDGHKVINDPIHGHIRLDGTTVGFIDTVQFQRLRDLKQLGSAYFVFPGGSHNRFEHSIGVSHLAGTLIERFKKEQPELDITEEEIQCVKLAGLCHDLGHGPYSHIFDNEFMPKARTGLGGWSHEQASEMMLEYLIDDNNIDIDAQQTNLIKDLIAGTPRSNSQYDDRGFLYDIVANKKNSVDVDKFDYIERDAQNLGLRSSYDAKRLLLYSRVVDNEICYHHKEVYNLYEMFHTRYSLFKRIYTHRVGKAIELMITDALLAADPHLGISKAVDNPEDYLNLTDDILRVIERSKSPELADARAIMKRLRTRQLYKFVDEFLVPPSLVDKLTLDVITAQEIVSHQSDNDNLDINDVIVSRGKINYAMQDQNPVDSIRFFSKFNDDESFTIPKHHVSYMIPTQFQEVVIRIFTRNPTQVQSIQKAFRKTLRSICPGDYSSIDGDTKIEMNNALTLPNDFDHVMQANKRRRSVLSSSQEDGVVKTWSMDNCY